MTLSTTSRNPVLTGWHVDLDTVLRRLWLSPQSRPAAAQPSGGGSAFTVTTKAGEEAI